MAIKLKQAWRRQHRKWREIGERNNVAIMARKLTRRRKMAADGIGGAAAKAAEERRGMAA
jgi:hypothetical protein